MRRTRFVTASSLFDGHDVSINLMRRLLQASGAEVIHLGHNRSALEVANAAIQEDAAGIAVSSYQGGHVDYFNYLIGLLRERGASDIRVYGGGGGVILPSEIELLEGSGVAKIFSPEDGRRLGLQGMIDWMLQDCASVPAAKFDWDAEGLSRKEARAIGKWISAAENGEEGAEDALRRLGEATAGSCPVIGMTGTGGAGKSTLADEWVRRYLRAYPGKTIAVLSVDPTKRRTGGALLGDRIRMNAVHSERVYMRSMATRDSGHELSRAIESAIAIVKAAGFDAALVETSGIGQGDSRVADVADASVYVMTADFGAPTQLEKIEMLDRADAVAINKFDRIGALDALRDVKKQFRRSRTPPQATASLDDLPVFGTMASRFDDAGVSALFAATVEILNRKLGLGWEVPVYADSGRPEGESIIPKHRTRYLGEIARTVRDYREFAEREARLASTKARIEGAIRALEEEGASASAKEKLERLREVYDGRLSEETREALREWERVKMSYAGETLVGRAKGKETTTELRRKSLSGLDIPRVSLPRFGDSGDLVRWLYAENVPGVFPFTAGVFPFKREEEDPKRQFAGEGTPERTNARFRYLSRDDGAKRLSTAFDSVTLYGEDPDERPDVFGKIGESGVSVCTLDDMKKLYAGFDLCDSSTSVSMTINGPAPVLLAMYMNAAIDDRTERFRREHERQPTAEEAEGIRRETLASVRGTVQADILKEDQGQNTCIFSTGFALRMMGDVQQYFIDQGVRQYYSVSVSGYHIAEAGANPVSQLAFTLANGFTYVEYYLSRGMRVDDFAPNFSFFFSNGLDPEYAVIGRVARRIWATAMKRRYGAGERSQKLKYHIQTSGRSLHAQEIDFNDIRTTLQALMAIVDNCNSLHTNSYDEAITTPTEQSVRRAMAIQLIVTKELGLARHENLLQGSFAIEELTDRVEEAVLRELERLDERGGVLGAMETQYQRGKIQDESMLYETLKHNGELPIVGVNTFLGPAADGGEPNIPLARATREEKERQLANLRIFQLRHEAEAGPALARLRQVASDGGNVFAELMETVKVASLGQITRALYEVGGQYRRNM